MGSPVSSKKGVDGPPPCRDSPREGKTTPAHAEAQTIRKPRCSALSVTRHNEAFSEAFFRYWRGLWQLTAPSPIEYASLFAFCKHCCVLAPTCDARRKSRLVTKRQQPPCQSLSCRASKVNLAEVAKLGVNTAGVARGAHLIVSPLREERRCVCSVLTRKDSSSAASLATRLRLHSLELPSNLGSDEPKEPS